MVFPSFHGKAVGPVPSVCRSDDERGGDLGDLTKASEVQVLLSARLSRWCSAALAVVMFYGAQDEVDGLHRG